MNVHTTHSTQCNRTPARSLARASASETMGASAAVASAGRPFEPPFMTAAAVGCYAIRDASDPRRMTTRNFRSGGPETAFFLQKAEIVHLEVMHAGRREVVYARNLSSGAFPVLNYYTDGFLKVHAAGGAPDIVLQLRTSTQAEAVVAAFAAAGARDCDLVMPRQEDITVARDQWQFPRRGRASAREWGSGMGDAAELQSVLVETSTEDDASERV